MLHNPKEVVAAWPGPPPIEGGKDESDVLAGGTPSRNGKLHVGGDLHTDDRVVVVVVVLNFKCANNNKPYYLTAAARGRDLKVAHRRGRARASQHADASHMTTSCATRRRSRSTRSSTTASTSTRSHAPRG